MNLVNKILNETEKFSVRTKLHFSDKPIEKIISYKDHGLELKPIGIWYSWGNVWLDWLYNPKDKKWWGNSAAKTYRHVFKFTIDFKNVLRIRLRKDFLNFYDNFGIPVDVKKFKKSLKGRDCLARLSRIDKYASNSRKHHNYRYPNIINWNKVAKEYSGIDIIFNDRCSEEFFWYSGWDCSSGCIWNSKIIKKIETVWTK